jgi:hypothetical protein
LGKDNNQIIQKRINVISKNIYIFVLKRLYFGKTSNLIIEMLNIVQKIIQIVIPPRKWKFYVIIILGI